LDKAEETTTTAGTEVAAEGAPEAYKEIVDATTPDAAVPAEPKKAGPAGAKAVPAEGAEGATAEEPDSDAGKELDQILAEIDAEEKAAATAKPVEQPVAKAAEPAVQQPARAARQQPAQNAALEEWEYAHPAMAMSRDIERLEYRVTETQRAMKAAEEAGDDFALAVERTNLRNAQIDLRQKYQDYRPVYSDYANKLAARQEEKVVQAAIPKVQKSIADRAVSVAANISGKIPELNHEPIKRAIEHIVLTGQQGDPRFNNTRNLPEAQFKKALAREIVRYARDKGFVSAGKVSASSPEPSMVASGGGGGSAAVSTDEKPLTWNKETILPGYTADEYKVARKEWGFSREQLVQYQKINGRPITN